MKILRFISKHECYELKYLSTSSIQAVTIQANQTFIYLIRFRKGNEPIFFLFILFKLIIECTPECKIVDM